MKTNDVLKLFKNRTARHLEQKENQNYAILLPIVEQNEALHVLFEVRAKNLIHQPGEICFPGGKVEEDDLTFLDAAIRETSEELGTDPQQITDVYPLDYLVGSMTIYPFVGRLLDVKKINPSPDEVEEVFTIPLAYLLETQPLVHPVDLTPTPAEDFPYELIPGGRNYSWFSRKMTQYFYLYEDRVVWGLTASILHHFLGVIKKNGLT